MLHENRGSVRKKKKKNSNRTTEMVRLGLLHGSVRPLVTVHWKLKTESSSKLVGQARPEMDSVQLKSACYGHWKLKTENSKRDVTQKLAKSRAAAWWINDVYRTYNTFSGSSPWIWTWSRGLWIKSKVPGFSGLKTLDSVFSPEKSPQQAFLSKTENWNLKTLDSVFSFQCTVTSGLTRCYGCGHQDKLLWQCGL